MKALNSLSVQILIVGGILCMGMYWVMSKELTIPTIFATAFSALVVGNKVRSNIQSSKGQYYDDETKTLKKVE